MKVKLQNLNYIVVFTIFSSAFTFGNIFSFADLRISYLIVVLALLSWLLFLKNVYFNKVFFFLFSIIIISSLYNIYIGKDTPGLLVKQVIGISLNAIIFYLLIEINKYDLKRLFKVYLNIAFLVGAIGLFQELSYLLNFKFGYDFHYIIPNWKISISQTGFLRINSILSEPSSFCYSMLPAFFVSLISFSKNSFRFLTKWKSLIIILSFFLTFSTVGYIGIVISIFLLMYNYRKIRYTFVSIILMFVFVFFLWNNIGDFQVRIGDSIDMLTGKANLRTINLSTFVLFSNSLVAYNSFKDNPIFGSGLGSHKLSYHKYINDIVDVNKISMFLNVDDANSLFSRLLSETGLFGIIIFFYFLFKFHLLKKRDESNYLWIINNAILAMFLIRLIRCGHYFINGFFFFFWLYYFSWKLNKTQYKNYEDKNYYY